MIDSIDKEMYPLIAPNTPFPSLPGDKSSYMVDFEENDPTHPHNWPSSRKLIQASCLALLTATITCSSAIFGPATPKLSEIYHIGNVVATLTTSLFVFGFAFGPVLWVATAENLQTIMICRFFGGFFGASPMVVVPASFADMFGPKIRGSALSVFATIVFAGPLFGPIIGSFIVENSHLGYRWLSYLPGIVGCSTLLLIVLFVKESSHRLILDEKAKSIRKETGNWAILSPQDEFILPFKEIVSKFITRPLVLLVTEPIILLFSIYNSFIYGLIYLYLSAYPKIFEEGYEIKNSGVASLPFIGLFIGVLGGSVFGFLMEIRYLKIMVANGKPVPEERLPTMIVGGILFPIGIFWLTWTGNYPHHFHWIVPTASGLVSGFAIITIFIPSLNYIVESYLMIAASAVAANTMMRCSLGGGFPLFADVMFTNLGTNYAGVVLGSIAAVLASAPILFYIYGKRIRGRSKLAAQF